MLSFIIAAVTLLTLDFIWLALIAKPFYMETIGKLMRVSNGSLEPLLLPAAIVYLSLLIGLVVFVFPKAEGKPLAALLWGGLFGFIAYAIYDFTNLAILNDWSLKMSIVDVIWGTFVCGITSCITVFIVQKFSGS